MCLFVLYVTHRHDAAELTRCTTGMEEVMCSDHQYDNSIGIIIQQSTTSPPTPHRSPT